MLCGFGAILFGVRGVWFVWSVVVGRFGYGDGGVERKALGFFFA